MAEHGASHALQTLGYRLTPQRQLVWDALRRSGGHVTAEDLCAAIQHTIPGFNIASVYRTLELLERIGLVRTSHLGDGRGRTSWTRARAATITWSASRAIPRPISGPSR